MQRPEYQVPGAEILEEATGQSIPKTFLNRDHIAELNQSLSVSCIKLAPAQQYGRAGSTLHEPRPDEHRGGHGTFVLRRVLMEITCFFPCHLLNLLL